MSDLNSNDQPERPPAGRARSEAEIKQAMVKGQLIALAGLAVIVLGVVVFIGEVLGWFKAFPFAGWFCETIGGGILWFGCSIMMGATKEELHTLFKRQWTHGRTGTAIVVVILLVLFSLCVVQWLSE